MHLESPAAAATTLQYLHAHVLEWPLDVVPPPWRPSTRAGVDNYQHPLYIVNVRKRHPKPEVEEALVFAARSGWTVRDTAAGHKWGDMRCPEASREGCRESIWSTPKNPGNHAKRLKARVRNCPHTGDRHD